MKKIPLIPKYFRLLTMELYRKAIPYSSFDSGFYICVSIYEYMSQR